MIAAYASLSLPRRLALAVVICGSLCLCAILSCSVIHITRQSQSLTAGGVSTRLLQLAPSLAALSSSIVQHQSTVKGENSVQHLLQTLKSTLTAAVTDTGAQHQDRPSGTILKAALNDRSGQDPAELCYWITH